jgi:membrane protein involved in colicin uptake
MNDTNTPTPEQIAEAKAAEAAKKAQEKAEAKAEKDRLAAVKKAEKDAEKAAKSEKAAADKAAKAQAKIDAKAAKAQAKEASKQPVQNDVRRPKPETTCGKCWSVYDRLSNDRGSPVAIADAKKVLEAEGVNEATIRTQYAHWRKFNGVTGRIESTEKPAEAPAA